jgi:multiple sugar transport system ATP-binding protein
MINQVRKAYGSVEVLHGVAIDIVNGEFVVLVGPSGCGKSTLLRMLAGLEDITGGEIAIDGRIINGLQPKERDNAMVFQSYALYPHMTVEQNIGFSLELAGISKVEAQVQIAKIAQTVSMEGYLNRYPRQLSGGQRQRVAMGWAMIRNPKVFCLMNHCQISIPSCVSRCAQRSSRTIGSLRPPKSALRMTKRKP